MYFREFQLLLIHPLCQKCSSLCEDATLSISTLLPQISALVCMYSSMMNIISGRLHTCGKEGSKK